MNQATAEPANGKIEGIEGKSVFFYQYQYPPRSSIPPVYISILPAIFTPLFAAINRRGHP
jgi:hypothetical protein